jgi:hypothetical protein
VVVLVPPQMLGSAIHLAGQPAQTSSKSYLSALAALVHLEPLQRLADAARFGPHGSGGPVRHPDSVGRKVERLASRRTAVGSGHVGHGRGPT